MVKATGGEQQGGELGFVRDIAKYFMDFLETDFHRHRNPKRSIKLKNSNNKQSSFQYKPSGVLIGSKKHSTASQTNFTRPQKTTRVSATFHVWPAWVSIIALILSALPIHFYPIGKLIAFCGAGYYAYFFTTRPSSQPLPRRFWLFLAIALMFNPFVPVYLYSSGPWIIVDIAAALAFYFAILKKGQVN